MIPYINWVVLDMMTLSIKQNYENATCQLWLYPRVPFDPFTQLADPLLPRACILIGLEPFTFAICNLIGDSFIHVNQDE